MQSKYFNSSVTICCGLKCLFILVSTHKMYIIYKIGISLAFRKKQRFNTSLKITL